MLHTWSAEDAPLRLYELARAKDDPEPKALACYGLLLRATPLLEERMLLRFVSGRPLSVMTTQFLTWCCAELHTQGIKALLLVWDNASWHTSHEVRTWVRDHNRRVKQIGSGVRILVCFLPSKSPWLNPIEPKWIHGKRAVTEPERVLAAQELADRVCAYFGCAHEPHLSIPEKVS